MGPRISNLRAFVLIAALLALGGVDTAAAGEAFKISAETQKLLSRHHLKKTSRKDPVEAIRRLDELRARGHETPDETGIALVEVALRAGFESSGPRAVGYFLLAATETHEAAVARAAVSSSGAGEPHTLAAHHTRALEGLVGALQTSQSPAFAGEAVEVEGPLATYRLSWEDAAPDWTFATHRFDLASEYDRGEKGITAARDAYGAALLAVLESHDGGKPTPEGGVFPLYHYFYPLTAILAISEANGGLIPVTLRVVDPRRGETMLVGDTEVELTFDFGAQFAAVRRAMDARFSTGAMLHPEKFLSLMGLYLLEPPRDDRVPAVLTHGLNSHPSTWEVPYEEFLKNETLRRSYQFWVFGYPTGLPFFLSSAFLRRDLIEVVTALDPGVSIKRLQNMVLVGHSMGGLISRMMVADAGTALWDSVFRVAPEDLGLPAHQIDLLRDALLVEPLPFISRAIFVATPHRGANLASGSIGTFGASLVKLPTVVKEASDSLVAEHGSEIWASPDNSAGIGDSIENLDPDSKLLHNLDRIGIAPGVTYHTIIGNQGKATALEESSDGFVPYWSSHLEGAESELVIGSGHSAHRHADGIAEIERILEEHLASIR